MSKYNNTKVEYDGHKFDSKAERDYYKHLLHLQETGVVEEFLMQKVYVLLEGYDKNGRKIRPITYIADFEVHYTNGTIEVVDVKGYPNETFPIKKKLFEYRYPFELKLVTYSSVDGGWISLDELKKARKKRKQLKLSKK